MKTAPCGSWKSPISAQTLVTEAVGLGSVRLVDGGICWIESRPSEAGRCVLMRRSADGRVAECTPAPFNVRTRVHEYGGGAYAVDGDTAYCANFADQRLYRVVVGESPQALTPEADLRYADGYAFASERLSCPLILLQGLEDKVVPPNQAEMMLAAVRAKGLPVAYLPFAGEQHGFRRAENITRALEAELYFYARVFGFELADAVAPVVIENL